MKLKQNHKNIFNVIIVVNDLEYLEKNIIIEHIIGSDKKYYYKIICPNSENFLPKYFFSDNYLEGVKGFGQHIISNNNFHMIYKEKQNQLELITKNNSVFIHGKLIE